MSTRKRKQDADEGVEEELQALPSDESEEEEEYVLSSLSESFPFQPSTLFLLRTNTVFSLFAVLCPQRNVFCSAVLTSQCHQV